MIVLDFSIDFWGRALKELLPILIFIVPFIIKVAAKLKKKWNASAKKRRRTRYFMDYMRPRPDERFLDDIDDADSAAISAANTQKSISHAPRQTTAKQTNNIYRNYRSKNNHVRKNPKLDVIRIGEIKTSAKQDKMQINIEKKQIAQAIMYAQILGQPKSLQYLNRFGVKRVVRED